MRLDGLGAGRTRAEPCGLAVDSWNRYEEDSALASAAGANAFRFSVSWSRIEPQFGEFDERRSLVTADWSII